jgi:hypothetical protein
MFPTKVGSSPLCKEDEATKKAKYEKAAESVRELIRTRGLGGRREIEIDKLGMVPNQVANLVGGFQNFIYQEMCASDDIRYMDPQAEKTRNLINTVTKKVAKLSAAQREFERSAKKMKSRITDLFYFPVRDYLSQIPQMLSSDLLEITRNMETIERSLAACRRAKDFTLEDIRPSIRYQRGALVMLSLKLCPIHEELQSLKQKHLDYRLRTTNNPTNIFEKKSKKGGPKNTYVSPSPFTHLLCNSYRKTNTMAKNI